MIIPKAINQVYKDKLAIVEKTGERVKDIITDFCSKHGYLFEDRIKSLESVTEKIETGRYENWSQIDDLYACTIVISLISDEDSVIYFLAKFSGMLSNRVLPKYDVKYIILLLRLIFYQEMKLMKDRICEIACSICS